jgi:hypothetical protein
MRKNQKIFSVNFRSQRPTIFQRYQGNRLPLVKLQKTVPVLYRGPVDHGWQSQRSNLLHSFRVKFHIFSTRLEWGFFIFSTRFEWGFYFFSTNFEWSFYIFPTRFECSFRQPCTPSGPEFRHKYYCFYKFPPNLTFYKNVNCQILHKQKRGGCPVRAVGSKLVHYTREIFDV